MQDRKAARPTNPLAAHGRTIHWVTLGRSFWPAGQSAFRPEADVAQHKRGGLRPAQPPLQDRQPILTPSGCQLHVPNFLQNAPELGLRGNAHGSIQQKRCDRRVDAGEDQAIGQGLAHAVELTCAEILADDRSHRSRQRENDAEGHWHDPADDRRGRHGLIAEGRDGAGHIGIGERRCQLREDRGCGDGEDLGEIAAKA